MDERIVVIEGDITDLEVDVIVNAANRSLLGGGGVDGAIHHAAGPDLTEECRALGGCETAQVKITGGHELPAKWVIHTVGPVWDGGTANEANLLADCYKNSLVLAEEYSAQTIAFPAISTGAYGFPPKRAAVIAVHTVRNHLAGSNKLEQVIFCTFGAQTTRYYLVVLEGPEPPNPFIEDLA